MNLKPKVRTRLLISQRLVTGRGSEPADPHRLECELILCHAAAEIAMAAICDQLECLPHKTHPCLLDYFPWLRKVKHPGVAVLGADYFADLHKARIDLQNRCLLPEPEKWGEVLEATQRYIQNWCVQYLNLALAGLTYEIEPTGSVLPAPAQSGKAAACHPTWLDEETGVGSTLGEPGSTGEKAVASSEERRYPRYDCSGEAELSRSHAGRPIKGRLVNLSLGGCYVETDYRLLIGTRLEVLLEANNLSFRAVGEVRSLNRYGGVGIEFMSMSAGGRQRLVELILELQGESGAESGTAQDAPSR